MPFEYISQAHNRHTNALATSKIDVPSEATEVSIVDLENHYSRFNHVDPLMSKIVYSH